MDTAQRQLSAFLSHVLGDTQHPSRRAVMKRFPKDVEAAVPSPAPQTALATHWQRARRVANRPDVRLYDLRHCLANAGVPEHSIQTGLRHKTATQTRRDVQQVQRGQNATVIAGLLAPVLSHTISHTLTPAAVGQSA